MKRYILTGAPGSGKTVLLRALGVAGYEVIEEAATDVIAAEQSRGVAEPWTDPSFIDAVVQLQKSRLDRCVAQRVQFHDRSAFCSAALAQYLGFPQSTLLQKELERLHSEATFEKRVFFVENLGFITPTEARRISFEESLRFEQIHKDVYIAHGFELVTVRPAPIEERVSQITSCL